MYLPHYLEQLLYKCNRKIKHGASFLSLNLGFEGKSTFLLSFVWHYLVVGVSRLLAGHKTWLLHRRRGHPQAAWPVNHPPFYFIAVLLLLFISFFLFFANSYSREAHSHPKVSVSESCQRAQGLSKQGENSPLPSALYTFVCFCVSVYTHTVLRPCDGQMEKV